MLRGRASRRAGKAAYVLDSPAEAARVIASLAVLGLDRTGAVIANPVPPRQQLDPDTHNCVLADGMREVQRRGLRGKAVTPYLLDYMKTATHGDSLRVNKQILRHNARVAAQIARALADLAAKGDS